MCGCVVMSVDLVFVVYGVVVVCVVCDCYGVCIVSEYDVLW